MEIYKICFWNTMKTIDNIVVGCNKSIWLKMRQYLTNNACTTYNFILLKQ